MPVYRQFTISTTPQKVAFPGERWSRCRYQVLGANVRMRYDDAASEITPGTGFLVYASGTEILEGGPIIANLHFIREASTDATLVVLLDT